MCWCARATSFDSAADALVAEGSAGSLDPRRPGAIIEHERDRANRLLHSILPAPIAERLQQAPSVIADSFDEVTVLFADIVGFTPLAARLRPEELVALLNDIFTRFDALAGQFGVEKIKTIGDAYMVVAGAPEPRADHGSAAADFALAMLNQRPRIGDAYDLLVLVRVLVVVLVVVLGLAIVLGAVG